MFQLCLRRDRSPVSRSCRRYIILSVEWRAESQMIERAVTGGRVIVRLDTEGQVWEPSDLCPCCCRGRTPRYTVRAHTIPTWHPSDNTTIVQLEFLIYEPRVSLLPKSFSEYNSTGRAKLFYSIKSIKSGWMLTWPGRWHQYINNSKGLIRNPFQAVIEGYITNLFSILFKIDRNLPYKFR